MMHTPTHAHAAVRAIVIDVLGAGGDLLVMGAACKYS